MSEGLAKIAGELLGRPVDTICGFVESLLGPSFKGLGNILGDQVAMWQWTNRLRIMERAQAILEEKGVATKVLPPDFVVPLMRECGDVEDETLQEAWARLLAGAVENDISQHIAFVHVLKQLSSTDARVIQSMISHDFVPYKERAEAIAADIGIQNALVRLSLCNLQRLGFFSPSGRVLRGFAIRFLKVCLIADQTVDAYLEKEDGTGAQILFD